MLRAVGACKQCGNALAEADRFCARCGLVVQDAEPQTRDALIGRTIGGAYVVLELVGVGGMGRVYRAEQSMLGRTVAIKVVHPHLLGDEQSVARFYTEARTASRLNHPNSVGIIDFGRTEDGILYLVMEYLRGKDLARVMHEEGPLPFPRIVDIVIGVLAALGEAHSLDIVHRDLKPENVILERVRNGGDFVKVVDFGLAKLIGNSRSTSITSPGLVCGTPDYMSPEQGRGEEVDNRGDLYAMGVVLFELLTDRLPFTDDTPTKVVLRHMSDPVPDPRVVAPARRIPDTLAEIAMKAMAKAPANRFQSAEEMATALRRAGAALRTTETASGKAVLCPSCAQPNPIVSRFCATCGARLPGMLVTPMQTATPRQSRAPAPEALLRPLIGRQRELDILQGLRTRAALEPVRAHLQGEAGVGKTRLLSQLEELALAAGDEVAAGHPHASGAPVAYEPIRALVRSLLDVEDEKLKQLASKDAGVFVDALSRAGASELLAPTGLTGMDGGSRAGAVAAMLATAVRVAAGRARSGRVVLIVDDIFACDGLSRMVLGDLPKYTRDVPLLVVTAAQRNPPPELATDTTIIALSGLSLDESTDLLAGGRGQREAAAPASESKGERRYLPLYLEQLRALGLTLLSGDDALPTRLADAISQRLERLDLPARRLLQAAAVLGECCSLGALEKLVDAKDRKGLDKLRSDGLVVIEGDTLRIAHPFFHDLVEASIPAEARKLLHERALELESDAGAPLEVRAEHAFRAGEPLSALVLLERMGDGALARGDASTGVLAFRRGLELARRELLETGDMGLDRAIASFSRKLGDALDRSGDAAGAEGVVREALDLTARDGIERARMLLVLGRAAARRHRHRDAIRVLGEAVDISTRLADTRIAAEAHNAIARVRREEGDEVGAANALRRAVELYVDAKAPLARQAAATVELAESLIDLGDLEGAMAHLERGARLAVDGKAPAIVALAMGTLATVDEIAGRAPQAAARYRDASLLAARAGDAEARDRWERAATERRRSGVAAPS
jgi:serine/threonine-protein kinase